MTKQQSIPRFANVSVSQDLTKERNSAAFECRKIVRAGLAKLTFVWDGKIFVVSNDDIKHKVQNVSDVKELLNTGKLPPKLQRSKHVDSHVCGIFIDTAASHWLVVVKSRKP